MHRGSKTLTLMKDGVVAVDGDSVTDSGPPQNCYQTQEKSGGPVAVAVAVIGPNVENQADDGGDEKGDSPSE